MEKSCQVIEILFWIGIGIVFYTYLGYGIVLYLMVKIKELFVKPRSPRLPEPLPEATLLIAAYNEEAIVASKMVNCRQLDYPADKLTFRCSSGNVLSFLISPGQCVVFTLYRKIV